MQRRNYIRNCDATMRPMSTGTTLAGVVPAGIIFDLDGVLMHSTPFHDQAYREVLAGFPLSRFDYAEIAGMRTPDALRKVFAGQNLAISEQELAELAERKTARAHELIVAANPVAPRCFETLSQLAVGYRLALASSASERTVRAFLDLSGSRELFRSIIWGSMVTEAKPAPAIYLRAAAELGLSPEQTLVVEDAVAGIQAGLGAGCTVCGITSMLSASELLSAGAAFTVTRLDELLAL
jgi:beta-phosphoglucomutase-like phosphatase (HAD superfamily)